MTDELSTSAWRDIAPNRDARDSMPPVRTRLLALALVFALLAVTILSPIATAHELHHDCTGAGCTICAELAGNLSIARGGDTVPVGATSFITLLLISALAIIGTERSSYAPVTLLSLRVRLDD